MMDAHLSVQLDHALSRNATFIVLLRHNTARMHESATGHSRAVTWTACNHPDCRKVAVLLDQRKPAKPA